MLPALPGATATQTMDSLAERGIENDRRGERERERAMYRGGGGSQSGNNTESIQKVKEEFD